MLSNRKPEQMEMFPQMRVWTPDEKTAYIETSQFRISMAATELNAFAEECRRVANILLRHAPRPMPKGEGL